MPEEEIQLKESLRPLANFARRAGIIVNGREKLRRSQKQLHCILVTCDISENSLREITQGCRCPIYQALQSADIEELFGLSNAKIIGFKQNPLAAGMAKLLNGRQIQNQ
jgi:hypothetical protein